MIAEIKMYGAIILMVVGVVGMLWSNRHRLPALPDLRTLWPTAPAVPEVAVAAPRTRKQTLDAFDDFIVFFEENNCHEAVRYFKEGMHFIYHEHPHNGDSGSGN